MGTGVVIELLDFVQTRGLPAAAVRVRMALDVIDCEASGSTSGSASRVTLAAVRVDENGRAHAPACATHGHLATLMWEILAGRVAETDELPWSDPADDLPAGVLDTFASLQLRQASGFDDLRRRFAAGIRSHASSHEEVARALSTDAARPTAPAPNPITLRAPAMQIEALRTLSATEAAQLPQQAEAAPTENLVATRVCPVVALPAVEDPVEALPRSTLDPWAAPPSLGVTETSAAVEVEPEPRRRRTWPIVAASLAAALVLIGLASRQRMAAANAPASMPAATVSETTTSALAGPAPQGIAPPAGSAPQGIAPPAGSAPQGIAPPAGSAAMPIESAAPSQTPVSATATAPPRVIPRWSPPPRLPAQPVLVEPQASAPQGAAERQTQETPVAPPPAEAPAGPTPPTE